MYHVVNIGGKLVRIAFFGVKKLTCLIIKKEKMKTTSPLNNNINTAVILAAKAEVQVTGKWNNDLMKQIKKPSKIEE